MSDLEARLVAVEDRLAIIDLIASYGPAVDTADAEAVAALWAADGVYAFDRTTLRGEQVAGLLRLPQHRAYIDAGCGHLLTTPRVRLERDHAIAVNHSVVVVHTESGWAIERLSANRWELERVDGVWVVRHRTAALLNGDAGSPALLDLDRP